MSRYVQPTIICKSVCEIGIHCGSLYRRSLCLICNFPFWRTGDSLRCFLHGLLHLLQAWDMDFITSSDCMGSAQIDLADSFDRALRERARRIKAGKLAPTVHPLSISRSFLQTTPLQCQSYSLSLIFYCMLCMCRPGNALCTPTLLRKQRQQQRKGQDQKSGRLARILRPVLFHSAVLLALDQVNPSHF